MKLKLVKVILFFSVCLIIPLLIFILPKEEVSYDENRTLADMPSFSFSTYLNESFMNDFESFLSDRFVLRKQFIIIKNNMDKLLGKNEIDSVFNLNGQLVQCFRRDNESISELNNQYINDFSEKNGKVYFALAPTVQEYVKNQLPEYLNLSDENEFINKCYSETENAKAIDLCPSMCSNTDDYLYYRTDHHWTSKGALISYNEIAKIMNLKKLSEKDFSIEKASDSFLGTLYSKTFDTTVKSDEIYFYKTENSDNIYVVTDGESHKSIYFTEYLNEKDKYVSFLGENKGILTVKNSNETKKLLLIKDSYANIIMQFLPENYGEITVLDLRYTKIADLKIINANDYDDILILYNVSAYYTDTNLSKINYIKTSE